MWSIIDYITLMICIEHVCTYIPSCLPDYAIDICVVFYATICVFVVLVMFFMFRPFHATSKSPQFHMHCISIDRIGLITNKKIGILKKIRIIEWLNLNKYTFNTHSSIKTKTTHDHHHHPHIVQWATKQFVIVIFIL